MRKKNGQEILHWVIHGGQNSQKTNGIKGVSLVLCQTEKGKSLLELAKIKLVGVNIEKAKNHNHQLAHPSKTPKSRENFIKHIKHGMKFNRAVLLALPKNCGKQVVKEVLIKGKLLVPGGGSNVQISVSG